MPLINKRLNPTHPPTPTLAETPQVPRLHTNPRGTNTTQSTGPTQADRIPQSEYSDYSNTVPQPRTQPVDPSEGQNTYSSLLVPAQVTPFLAPLDIEGLDPVQDSHTCGLQDNVYIGDVMGLPKSHTTMQLYFQNVNSINLHSSGNWSNICEHVRDIEVSIALLAEHKLDTTQPRVMLRLYKEAQKTFGLGAFLINTASTDIPSPTVHKPGGVLSLVNGGIKGRVLRTDQDHWGGGPQSPFGKTVETRSPLSLHTKWSTLTPNKPYQPHMLPSCIQCTPRKEEPIPTT